MSKVHSGKHLPSHQDIFLSSDIHIALVLTLQDSKRETQCEECQLVVQLRTKKRLEILAQELTWNAT